MVLASSDRARDLVAALPWHEGGRVRIVSVVPTSNDLVGIPWALAATPDALEARRARRCGPIATPSRPPSARLRSARSDLVIEPVLARGRAASLIVEEARSMPADLVVVGHRGHGRWESILLGSVSAEVVDHAPCPVLVARDERLGPVVLADDRSIHARAAETFLAGLAAVRGPAGHRRDRRRGRLPWSPRSRRSSTRSDGRLRLRDRRPAPRDRGRLRGRGASGCARRA